jgi:hypothetical protein
MSDQKELLSIYRSISIISNLKVTSISKNARTMKILGTKNRWAFNSGTKKRNERDYYSLVQCPISIVLNLISK